MNIIVTGVGGDIGNGIGRILRDSKFAKKIIGCDIHNEHSGLSIFDECLILPSAYSPNFLKSLKRFSKKYEADAVIITSEPELRILANLNVRESLKSLPLVMANQKAMSIGFDKLKTIEFIASLGEKIPWTKIISESDPDSYPCILKNRMGSGSKSVYILTDPSKLEAYKALYPDYLCQEYVGNEDAEYTCGVYGCADGEIRTIIFRRRLISGYTSYAELAENKEISSLCKTIAIALELKGSINIQLRYTNRGPIIFEINPRFSSTVGFRHKLGFTDLIWSIEEQIFGLKTFYNSNYPVGTKLHRVFDERIL